MSSGVVLTVATGVVRGRAVTGGEDGTVRLWDLITRQQVDSELVFTAPVHAVTLTRDGRLAVAFGREVAVLAPR